MAILQVRDLNDGIYSSLKQIAKMENRSISQEVIYILEKYLSNPTSFKYNPTQEFLKLSSSWEDSRSSDDIIKDIKASRKNSKRFETKHVIFD